MNYEILVNKENPLSSDYIPENLIEIHEPTGEKLDSTYVNMLDKSVYQAFKMMQQEALKFGYEIFVDSSYRSYDYQKAVFDALVIEKGLEYARKHAAVPGTSEHQTGFAIDVIFRRNGIMIEEQNEKDPEIVWLMQNAYHFGFILRYPKDKVKITGYNFEPWHYRFVGELAKELYFQNLTLEEYYLLAELKPTAR